MSWTDAMGAVAIAGFASLGIWHMVGPLGLRADHVKSTPPGIRARLAAWRRRPRPPITAEDWKPYGGLLFLPAFIEVGLVYGGVFVLVGPGQTFRLGGLTALLGGVPVVALIVLYMRRPATRRQKPDQGPDAGSIPVRSRGYSIPEVDEFLQNIADLERDDIDRATFSTARPGYDESVVDDLLDQWAAGGMPGDQGRHTRPQG